MAARIQTTNPVRGKFVRLPSGPAPVHHRCLRHRHKLYAHNEASSSRDEDYNDDGAALAAEFEKFRRADPQGASKHAKHLDLLWRLQTDRKRPEMCDGCRGSGERECEYCHGTGLMTVGDTLFCTDQGCRPCPVCRGSGACMCSSCRGTGKRAAWISR